MAGNKTDNRPNLLIDAKNLSYRMFSTLDLWNSDGENVASVFGVIKNIHSLVNMFDPKRVIVCWDTATSSQWRKKLYPEYKGNRRKDQDEEALAKQEDFERQNDILQFALAWLPIYQIVEDELEADDILYLLTQKMLKDETNIVVSTDKDLLQLINENTYVWSPIKEKMITDPKNVWISEELGIATNTFEEYMGFPPEHFIDFKVLQGDKSDGIAGIQGIGEKTAITLLEQYGSIENMLENADELRKSKRNAKIVDNEELLQTLKSIMDISEVENNIEDAISKVKKGVIQPAEDYKKFWNFARDNDFKSIFMDYRLWTKPFEKMGLNPLFKRKKRKPKSKAV